MLLYILVTGLYPFRWGRRGRASAAAPACLGTHSRERSRAALLDKPSLPPTHAPSTPLPARTPSSPAATSRRRPGDDELKPNQKLNAMLQRILKADFCQAFTNNATHPLRCVGWAVWGVRWGHGERGVW